MRGLSSLVLIICRFVFARIPGYVLSNGIDNGITHQCNKHTTVHFFAEFAVVHIGSALVAIIKLQAIDPSGRWELKLIASFFIETLPPGLL